jgi:hypothetical protein
MSDYLLKSEARKFLSPTLKPFADKAVDIFFKANPGYEKSPYFEPYQKQLVVSIAVDLASVAKEAGKNLKKRSGPPRPVFEYSADNLSRSEKMLELIRPVVEKLRLELFGKREAPFADYDAALRWIGEEAPAEATAFFEKTGDMRARVKELDGEIERLVLERNELEESYLTGTVDYRTVPVQLASGFRTFPGTMLRTLALTVRSMAAITNFRENHLTVYVLVGIKPVQKLIDISVYGPVSVRDLVAFYRRHFPAVKRARRISPASLAIVEFIKARGGVPAKGKMKFWENAARAWNKVHKRNSAITLDGIKRAYERALKRLSVTGRKVRAESPGSQHRILSERQP